MQVFRELDAPDEEEAAAADAPYASADEDGGSQSEADEPAFKPTSARGRDRGGGQRRRLQV